MIKLVHAAGQLTGNVGQFFAAADRVRYGLIINSQFPGITLRSIAAEHYRRSLPRFRGLSGR